MKRKIVEIDKEKCDGCGLCIPSCMEGALQIVNGKAKLVNDSYCDGLGACINYCPKGAIKIIEREVNEVYQCNSENKEKTIEGKISKLDNINDFHKIDHSNEALECECNRSFVKSFENKNQNNIAKDANNTFSHGTKDYEFEGDYDNQKSELSHWPVQLRLVPSNASFLKNAEILLCADCVPFALSNLHKRYIKGRVVLVGCPKLDDSEYYICKLTEIFTIAKPRSIKVLIMEVPCCKGLVAIVKRAISKTNAFLPISVDIIGIEGGVLETIVNV